MSREKAANGVTRFMAEDQEAEARVDGDGFLVTKAVGCEVMAPLPFLDEPNVGAVIVVLAACPRGVVGPITS